MVSNAILILRKITIAEWDVHTGVKLRRKRHRSNDFVTNPCSAYHDLRVSATDSGDITRQSPGTAF